MDVDKPAVVPKTATLAPSSTVQPKRAVDRESMAFSQGGHLMSNKKCKLPDGSFKRAKKGYEEIHVPAPKQQPVTDGELVPIASLPKWAQDAFTAKTLNRVQSKLYPIAFGIDERIYVVCAYEEPERYCFSFRSGLFCLLSFICRRMWPC
jgi:pre-mRNA-splicing helicase BRR2